MTSVELFDPGMERRVELDVGRGSRTRASGQYEWRTTVIVEIEGVDQIIRLGIALGERIEVEPLLDEFQHRGELEHRMSDMAASGPWGNNQQWHARAEAEIIRDRRRHVVVEASKIVPGEK